MTTETFGRIIALLREMQGQPAWTAGTEVLYQFGLMDMDDEEAVQALGDCVLTSKWRPAVSEIRAAAAKRIQGDLPTPEEVYSDISEKIARFGLHGKPEPWGWSPGTPEFDLPASGRVVTMLGGWRRCCEWEHVEGSFQRAVHGASKSVVLRATEHAQAQLKIPPAQRRALTDRTSQPRIGGLEQVGSIAAFEAAERGDN